MVTQTEFRVIYGDTDAMGHAYYGNYLRWFEIGRSEWFRRCGMTYREIEDKGTYLPVLEAHCSYKKPALYDDVLVIATTFRFEGPARLRFDYEIVRAGEPIAGGYTVHACVNENGKPVKPPRYLTAALRQQEHRGE
jgi:acyl-CoA thioester hydrolase